MKRHVAKSALTNYCATFREHTASHDRIGNSLRHRKLRYDQEIEILFDPALDLMHEISAIIKRPLLESNDMQPIGFSAQNYSGIFNH